MDTIYCRFSLLPLTDGPLDRDPALAPKGYPVRVKSQEAKAHNGERMEAAKDEWMKSAAVESFLSVGGGEGACLIKV